MTYSFHSLLNHDFRLIITIPDDWDKIHEKDFRRAYHRATYTYHHLEERGEHPKKFYVNITKMDFKDACDLDKYLPHTHVESYVAHASKDCNDSLE